MNKQQAKTLLALHSARHNDTENPQWVNGFVNSMRPFKSQQMEQSMHQVMHAIFCLYDELKSNKIEKEVLADLWTIVHWGKQWGYSHADLLTEEQQHKFDACINYISWAVFGILDGNSRQQAFDLYFCVYPEHKNFLLSTAYSKAG